MKIAGIDVGVRKSHIAIVEGRKVVYVGDFDEDIDVSFKLAGIDAPLSFPAEGHFRECERKLQKMGIRLIPPKFLKRVVARGLEIAEFLRAKGVEVYEVYPYATRRILNIAPKANKKKDEERRMILNDLRRYLDVPDLDDHNLIDALISALTVKMMIEGRAKLIDGKDGAILIPQPI
jgi:predicted nuclease with RNAse H fold